MRKLHLTLVKGQYENTIPVYADWFYKEPKMRSKKEKIGFWICKKIKIFIMLFFIEGKILF